MDRISQQQRSAVMSRVRAKNTSLEIRVRRLLYGLGYRYRLHAPDLPGKPDIVFRTRRKVIFVHGCFWHQHPGCPRAVIPASRQEFWYLKLSRNRERDAETLGRFAKAGWSVRVVWQCELRDGSALAQQLVSFLGPAVWRARKA